MSLRQNAGFVLSLLLELGTMGSKRGGVGVTLSATSSQHWRWVALYGLFEQFLAYPLRLLVNLDAKC